MGVGGPGKRTVAHVPGPYAAVALPRSSPDVIASNGEVFLTGSRVMSVLEARALAKAIVKVADEIEGAA